VFSDCVIATAQQEKFFPISAVKVFFVNKFGTTSIFHYFCAIKEIFETKNHFLPCTVR